MNRFDALAPHKPALRSIAEGSIADPGLLSSFLSSQAWMLNAAGVATDGIDGNARVLGLASIYASVFRTWLDDDDPGLARTMAVLDRRLRRGESTARTMDDVLAGCRRLAGLVTGGIFASRSNASGAGPAAGQSPGASAHTP